MRRATGASLRGAALALVCGAAAACRGGQRAAPDPASVSADLLSQDSTALRVRVCNNGFQPIRHIELAAPGLGLAADTTLGQAHCADLSWGGAYPRVDSASLTVTRVERP